MKSGVEVLECHDGSRWRNVNLPGTSQKGVPRIQTDNVTFHAVKYARIPVGARITALPFQAFSATKVPIEIGDACHVVRFHESCAGAIVYAQKSAR